MDGDLLMYMYHFVNTKGWGDCYTVMSNNKIEARTALKNYLDKINETIILNS